MSQFVDPLVSEAKFDREISVYRASLRLHSQRGWWLVQADFPKVVVAFVSPNLRPRVVTCAVIVDFTNYDVWAPSVSFVDVFSREPVLTGQAMSALPRLDPNMTAETRTAAAIGQTPWPVSYLLQGYPGKPVFLCLQGVREYHEHPAHTGDKWPLHRGTGRGTLYNILDVISRYGSEPIDSQQVQIGFSQKGIPA